VRFWLFGSALAGFVGFARRQLTHKIIKLWFKHKSDVSKIDAAGLCFYTFPNQTVRLSRRIAIHYLQAETVTGNTLPFNN